MSVTLKRHVKLEPVTLQVFTGVDGQGKPSYAKWSCAINRPTCRATRPITSR